MATTKGFECGECRTEEKWQDWKPSMSGLSLSPRTTTGSRREATSPFGMQTHTNKNGGGEQSVRMAWISRRTRLDSSLHRMTPQLLSWTLRRGMKYLNLSMKSRYWQRNTHRKGIELQQPLPITFESGIARMVACYTRYKSPPIIYLVSSGATTSSLSRLEIKSGK